MTIYVVLLFNKENYPSTTEYKAIFKTRKEASRYIYYMNEDLTSFQELYIKEVIL